ncbi:MAG: hypothetical protein OEL83_06935 [Desulforhopalus sp.]|nr:hypothetical protein [Desulforhopalus sp.]
MNIDTIKSENAEFILARLRLAQALLEESDHLVGNSGYNHSSDRWWLHPRHEREALVAYLLLTCFDRLGQVRRFMTHSDWLKSKKTQHIAERSKALDCLPTNATPVEAACALADEYQSLYGVRNAFCNGIDSLPEEGRKRLFSSIRLVFRPEFMEHGSNVSTRACPLEDVKLERELQVKHLYKKRNQFTHRLDQFQMSSTPMVSDSKIPNGSSWVVEITDEKLFYWGVHQEHEPVETGGAYVYTIIGWPFVLFEVLYDAIGLPFERTSIKLRFHVKFFSSGRPNVVGYNAVVEHHLLKDFRSLARNFWADIDERERHHRPPPDKIDSN